MAKGQGWYGGLGTVNKISGLKIDNKVYVLAVEKPINLDSLKAKENEMHKENKDKDAELLASTIANMSADQKRVLGLT